MERIAYLKKVPLFTDLTNVDLKRMSKIGSIQKYNRGKMIFDEDTSGGKFYVVMSGRVKIFTSSGSKKKTLAYLEKSEFFGEMALLDMEPRSASSIALDDCELFVIKKQDFRGLLAKYPGISFQIMKTLSKRLRQTNKEIEALTFGNVISRIASALIDLALKYGEDGSQGCKINMPFSHQDIAELAGTGREMVSRILNRFRRLNCISYSNRCLVITDMNKLKQWIR
ncbi:MAG: Crp/Fnr family transcriptional regulator [Endomicrobiales bacterium]|nr:Crp/Fnr family transcriptional regulator [Endomicrobiales bacterium]